MPESTHAAVIDLPLVGPGGEPVDLWRAFISHGLAALPPNRLDRASRSMEVALALPGGSARRVRLARAEPGVARATVAGPPLTPDETDAVAATLRRMVRLDLDLSGFYAQVADDPDLAWAAAGAGRLMRGATVFQDVVTTICTTNCAWSATVRMVGALVEHLGEPVGPDDPATGPAPRAFPTPAAMAAAPESFYRDIARAGYRGGYLRTLAQSVASGDLDLEPLAIAAPDGPDDDEARARLLSLPGVGPYAAAHVMMLLGRHRSLVFDSWTRPTFARLHGEALPDRDIAARFDRYGPYAGLAFWLYLTREWDE